MKKIGIITYHHRENYGGTLQSIALYKILRSLGTDVELIDYRPHRIWLRDQYALIANRLQGGDGHVKNKLFADYLKANSTRGPFVISRGALKRNYGSKFDVLITGSDEVWNTTNPRGFDPSYFLDFAAPQTTKISYAASAGGDPWASDKHERLRTLLHDFKHILVRDHKTAKLVGEITGQAPPLVLDPTFLISNWEKGSRPLADEYIFVAGALSSANQALVVKTAQRMNCKIVSGGYKYKLINPDKTVLSVPDWVSSIAHARLVASSLFHATAFSIGFGVNFTVSVPPLKKDKIAGLLEAFFPNENIGLNFCEDTLRANEISHQKLREMRADSIELLRKAIDM